MQLNGASKSFVSLSHQHCFLLSNKLTSGAGVKLIKDGACHRLIIDCCSKDDSAVYRFEAEGRKSEATLDVKGKKRKKKTEMFQIDQGIIYFCFSLVFAFSFFKRPTKG